MMAIIERGTGTYGGIIEFNGTDIQNYQEYSQRPGLDLGAVCVSAIRGP